MTEATTTSTTRRDGDDGSHLADVRAAAAEHAPKHRGLIRSARDGRLLSALMLPWVLAWPGSILPHLRPHKSLETSTDFGAMIQENFSASHMAGVVGAGL